MICLPGNPGPALPGTSAITPHWLPPSQACFQLLRPILRVHARIFHASCAYLTPGPAQTPLRPQWGQPWQVHQGPLLPSASLPPEGFKVYPLLLYP